MKNEVYVDHSATTFVKKEVLKEMMPYFTEEYGNPSSTYYKGAIVKKRIDEARNTVAKCIGADANEIYFTSGGSEADNLAIRGIALANREKGNHIITSRLEHSAVLNTVKDLEKNYGFKVTYLNVPSSGIVDIKEFKSKITDKTILVSIMGANNEIGTLQPIEEIARICDERGIYFHTDCVQVMGHKKIDVKKMKIASLSMSSHKFYGPKGVGVMYMKNGIEFTNLIFGGHQESSKRAGTENTAGIIGMSKAIKLATDNIEKNYKYVLDLREYTLNRMLNEIPFTKLNGDRKNRLPGNINVRFDKIDSSILLELLNFQNIYASNGSACNSSEPVPSHVLKAIGLTDDESYSSLRITIDAENTKEEMDYVVECLKEDILKLRNQSESKND